MFCTSGFVDDAMFAHNQRGLGDASIGIICQVAYEGYSTGLAVG